MADLDSSEVRQKISDIREWIFEAVDKIGAPMQYISKESGADDVPVFPIQDNQIPIPADLVVLDGVAFSDNPKGPWVPMTVSTSIFREPKKHHNKFFKRIQATQPHDQENYAIDDEVVAVPEHQPMQHKLMTSQSQFYDASAQKYFNTMFGGVHKQSKPEYFVKPGWLVTNKPKGFIKLAYKAIAVDERGYPLIPDLTSYQEAIYWYVVMKLSFPKFMEGTLSGRGTKYSAKYSQSSYYFIQQQWNFYRNQAYAEAMMPTADDMRNIQNEWNRLIPEFESGDTFYKDINKREHIYNDYYNGY